MKLLILSTIALVILTNTLTQTATDPASTISTTATNPNCVKAYCSCVDQNAAATTSDTCSNAFETMCYKEAECKGQSDNGNQCGWTQDELLTICLNNAKSLSGVLSYQKAKNSKAVGKKPDTLSLGSAQPDQNVKKTDQTKSSKADPKAKRSDVAKSKEVKNNLGSTDTSSTTTTTSSTSTTP
jgi:hypothetical protein